VCENTYVLHTHTHIHIHTRTSPDACSPILHEMPCSRLAGAPAVYIYKYISSYSHMLMCALNAVSHTHTLEHTHKRTHTHIFLHARVCAECCPSEVVQTDASVSVCVYWCVGFLLPRARPFSRSGLRTQGADPVFACVCVCVVCVVAYVWLCV
jgi:hypothetical protein